MRGAVRRMNSGVRRHEALAFGFLGRFAGWIRPRSEMTSPQIFDEIPKVNEISVKVNISIDILYPKYLSFSRGV
jgi:hypothetical protein